jgi:hypothetical protein
MTPGRQGMGMYRQVRARSSRSRFQDGVHAIEDAMARLRRLEEQLVAIVPSRSMGRWCMPIRRCARRGESCVDPCEEGQAPELEPALKPHVGGAEWLWERREDLHACGGGYELGQGST